MIADDAEARRDPLEANSLGECGILLWLAHFGHFSRGANNWFDRLGTDSTLSSFVRKMCQGVRACRIKRELFPLPSMWSEFLKVSFDERDLHTVLNSLDFERVAVCCWSELAVIYLNYLRSRSFGKHLEKPTVVQRDLLKAIERCVGQVLKDDCNIQWNAEAVEQDLKKKNLSYEGEEVAKAEELSLARVAPALPPVGHGGAIDICQWVSGRTLWYLRNPLACIQPDVGQPLPKLQAKVHIRSGEKLSLARLLVERNICTWTRDHDVLRYREERVLNGLFGVEKSSLCPSGETMLRCIMNLIPSNSVLKTLEGRVHRLPSIWAIDFFWHGWRLAGGGGGRWPAVGGRANAFMTECQQEAETHKRTWWQVYLDNFAGGERVGKDESGQSGKEQALVEKLWADAGILSSEKKSVTEALAAVELGAFVGGKGQWVGGSAERLLKTIKLTMWLLEKGRLNRKRLQIVLGRWVFILQFRRPAMSHFEDAWQVIAEGRVKSETFCLEPYEMGTGYDVLRSTFVPHLAWSPS